MIRFRSRWLALFGGAVLIALSLSSAWGAKPDAGTNRGHQVSAFVHGPVGNAGETTNDETQAEDATDSEADSSDSSAHGACVSKVARSDAVGGDNENHGGAVSEAARVTCWEGTTTDGPATGLPADDDGEGKAGAGPPGNRHGHGHGHGGDSSDS